LQLAHGGEHSLLCDIFAIRPANTSSASEADEPGAEFLHEGFNRRLIVGSNGLRKLHVI
jgi:hypothetical protein